jgi:hypothetical protein
MLDIRTVLHITFAESEEKRSIMPLLLLQPVLPSSKNGKAVVSEERRQE